MGLFGGREASENRHRMAAGGEFANLHDSWAIKGEDENTILETLTVPAGGYGMSEETLYGAAGY